MLNGLINMYIPMYKTLIPIFQEFSLDLLVIDRAVIPVNLSELASTVRVEILIIRLVAMSAAF